MALNKQQMIDKALAIIPQEECVTLEEVWLFLGITRTTAFNYELNKNDEIKEAVQKEKIKVKKKLRRRWRDSDNATLQIAEFKLCSDDEELARLNTQKVNADIAVTGKGRVIMEMPDDDGVIMEMPDDDGVIMEMPDDDGVIMEMPDDADATA